MASPEPSKRKSAKKACKVTGCRNRSHAKNLCQKHYDIQRNKSAGRKKRPKRCRHKDCGAAVHANGYCRKHYDMTRRSGGRKPRGRPPVRESRREDKGAKSASKRKTRPLPNLKKRLEKIKKRHALFLKSLKIAADKAKWEESE